MTVLADRIPPRDLERPGWLEVAVAAAVYFIGVLFIGLWVLRIPDSQAALRGYIEMGANGVAGAVALAAAVAVRLRRLEPFGFRPVAGRWLALGAGLALIAFGASFVIEHVYALFIDEAPVQGNYQAAAKGGALSLAIILITGAILTPAGEEFVFRAVLANALNRYGVFVGVVVSALIFGLAHGLNVILLDAFMIGLITAVLFRRTASVYPGLVVHMTYNALHLVAYSFL